MFLCDSTFDDDTRWREWKRKWALPNFVLKIGTIEWAFSLPVILTEAFGWALNHTKTHLKLHLHSRLSLTSWTEFNLTYRVTT